MCIFYDAVPVNMLQYCCNHASTLCQCCVCAGLCFTQENNTHQYKYEAHIQMCTGTEAFMESCWKVALGPAWILDSAVHHIHIHAYIHMHANTHVPIMV